MALARKIIRNESLPLCAVCGDRREPSGSAYKAHEKGIHHRANAVLTRRAAAGWSPLTDQLLSVLKRLGVEHEVDGHWSDEDVYRRRHIVTMAFARIEDVASYVEDAGDAEVAFGVRAGWGPWLLAATRFAMETTFPWWIAVRATDPQAVYRYRGDASVYRNPPIGVIRGRPWPRPWHHSAPVDMGTQGELSLVGGSHA